MDDKIFREFERFSNNKSKDISVANDKYTVFQRNAKAEFAEFSGMNLKNPYWLIRIVDNAVANFGKWTGFYIFKLITGNEINYLVVQDITNLTTTYKGKIFLTFDFKTKLQNIYNFDKIFTLYFGEGGYRSMYDDEVDNITTLWEQSES